ncbi:MAG: peptidase domain-containing ABC transporter [Candidatus Delongbacteria bacterium]
MVSKDSQIFDALKTIPIFLSLSEGEISKIAECVTIKELKLGEVLFEEGSEIPSMVYIFQGSVRLKKKIGSQVISIGKYSEGNYFGEISLLSRAKFQYTISSASKSIVFLIDSGNDEIKKISDKLKIQIARSEFTKTIRNLFSTQDIEEAWFHDMADNILLSEYYPGEIIFRQESENRSLFLVLSGMVELYKETVEGEYFIGKSITGDYFGEYGALSQKAQGYKAVCFEQTVALEIPSAYLQQFFNYNPELLKLLKERIISFEKEEERQKQLEEKADQKDRDKIEYFSIGSKKFPWLRQHDETDCGAACLTMISKFYGLNLSMGQVREMANVNTAGATMSAVCRAAENLGYRARGLKSTLPALKQLKYPMIAHWQGFHYIVLYRMDSKYIWVADPDLGIKKYTHEYFKENWTGYVIELEPTLKLKEIEPAKNPLFRFLGYLKPFRFFLFEILLAAFVLNILGLASPLFMQAIIDKVVVYKDVTLLNMMLTGMILVAFFSTLTSGLQSLLGAHITAKMDFRMLAEFYKHVLSMPMKFFYQRKIGDIITRFGENAKVRSILTNTIISTILNIIMLIVFVNIMFMYNSKLSLIVLAFVPLYIAQMLFFTPIFIKLSNQMFHVGSEQSSLMIESIQGIETIKANGVEWNIRSKWEDKYLQSVNMSFKLNKLDLLSGVISQAINTASSISILWYGAIQVINGTMSIGELMAFNAIIGSVLGPLMGLVSLYNDYQQVKTSMDRLNDVLEAEPEEKAITENIQQKVFLNNPVGDIEFKDLCFRYGDEDSPLVINGLNLKISAGTQVAFVGSSGCGKSTLIKMVPGFLRASSGTIFIDGIDINSIDINSLRKNIGWVLQDSFLFNATVEENIALGYSKPSEKDVSNAADLAAANEFITAFPHSYKTKIGDKGFQLSGGQRQRVCIARALYRNPKIILFDEATSALDAESERRIQQNLIKIMKGRTSIVIAHRLSTIRDADMICYMHNGVIMEKGTHDELMDKRGLYYAMASQQLGKSSS